MNPISDFTGSSGVDQSKGGNAVSTFSGFEAPMRIDLESHNTRCSRMGGWSARPSGISYQIYYVLW